jgi:hypothetical protein
MTDALACHSIIPNFLGEFAGTHPVDVGEALCAAAGQVVTEKAGGIRRRVSR